MTSSAFRGACRFGFGSLRARFKSAAFYLNIAAGVGVAMVTAILQPVVLELDSPEHLRHQSFVAVSYLAHLGLAISAIATAVLILRLLQDRRFELRTMMRLGLAISGIRLAVLCELIPRVLIGSLSGIATCAPVAQALALAYAGRLLTATEFVLPTLIAIVSPMVATVLAVCFVVQSKSATLQAR